MYFQKRLYGACLDLAQSTEAPNDCRPSAWGNKPVFNPGCRNHLVLWGILHFFLIRAKALQTQSFKFPQSGGTCDCLGYLERSTPKSQGCSWNLLLPIDMFWLLLCFPLPSVTIWRQVSPSPLGFLGFLPVLIFFFFCPVLPLLLFLFFSFDLTLQNSASSSSSSRTDCKKAFVCICSKKWRYAQGQSIFF